MRDGLVAGGKSETKGLLSCPTKQQRDPDLVGLFEANNNNKKEASGDGSSAVSAIQRERLANGSCACSCELLVDYLALLV